MTAQLAASLVTKRSESQKNPYTLSARTPSAALVNSKVTASQVMNRFTSRISKLLGANSPEQAPARYLS